MRVFCFESPILMYTQYLDGVVIGNRSLRPDLGLTRMVIDKATRIEDTHLDLPYDLRRIALPLI
jgi:hypothetical protein